MKLEKTIKGVGECKGMTFIRVAESDRGYIYQCGSYYEVFRKKSVPLCIDFENRIYSETETKEVYPKSKDFGVWAWTYDKLYKAEQKLEELGL